MQLLCIKYISVKQGNIRNIGNVNSHYIIIYILTFYDIEIYEKNAEQP